MLTDTQLWHLEAFKDSGTGRKNARCRVVVFVSTWD